MALLGCNIEQCKDRYGWNIEGKGCNSVFKNVVPELESLRLGSGGSLPRSSQRVWCCSSWRGSKWHAGQSPTCQQVSGSRALSISVELEVATSSDILSSFIYLCPREEGSVRTNYVEMATNAFIVKCKHGLSGNIAPTAAYSFHSNSITRCAAERAKRPVKVLSMPG